MAMSDVRQLEREINDLQRQLRQQNAEANRTRQNLIDSNRRNLEAYQRDMQRALREHDTATQAEYERLLSQYQKSINSDVNAELSKMNSDYNRLLNDVKRNEELLLRKNEELEKEILAIRKDATRKNEGSRQEAMVYLQNATSAFHIVEKRPHEKFAPNRLRVYFNAIKDGQQLYKAGLFEAGMAVAVSAKSGLERLGYTIDDKVDEWDRQFDLFSLKLKLFQTKIQQELDDWEVYIGKQSKGDKKLRTQNLIEINFWSRGDFANAVLTAKKYQMYITSFNKVGKEEYLKQKESPSTDDLKKFIAEIESSTNKLNTMIGIYKKRYDASCQRFDWAEKIIDFLTTEINLIWIENLTGYKKVSEDVADSKDYIDYIRTKYDDLSIKEDVREWLKIVFENSSKNKIYIYILPIEKNNNVVNHIILHIDYGGAEQKTYSRDIYQHICEAINLTEESDAVVNYAADVNELKVSTNKAYSDTGKDLERTKQKKEK